MLHAEHDDCRDDKKQTRRVTGERQVRHERAGPDDYDHAAGHGCDVARVVPGPGAYAYLSSPVIRVPLCPGRVEPATASP